MSRSSLIRRWSLSACSALLLATGVAFAQSVTVTGELIDTFCYAAMGAKGESHRQCAVDCVSKGIPAGILQDGTDKVYVLLPAKDKSPLPKTVMDKVGRKATITGRVYSVGGTQFLTVDSIK